MARRRKALSGGERAYIIGIVMGIAVGAFFCLAGFLIVILGFTGSIEWIVKGESFTSKITNAGPGVVFALLGAIILWRYKPQHRHEELIDENSGRRWMHMIDELKAPHLDVAHFEGLRKLVEGASHDNRSETPARAKPQTESRPPEMKNEPGSEKTK